MRLSRRDMLVTAIVGAVVVPYVGYLVRGSMPYIQDPRGMAGVGLIGFVAGLAVWAFGGRSSFGSTALIGLELLIGLVALGVGVAALALGSEALLAWFVGALVLIWAVEMLSRAGLLSVGRASEA